MKMHFVVEDTGPKGDFDFRTRCGAWFRWPGKDHAGCRNWELVTCAECLMHVATGKPRHLADLTTSSIEVYRNMIETAARHILLSADECHGHPWSEHLALAASTLRLEVIIADEEIERRKTLKVIK